jgi:hypothetical protein
MLYRHRFFNFALEHAIRKVREKQVGLKLNGTHQFLVYANDENLLGDNIDTAKKNTETLLEASKGVRLEVIAEKSKYMLLSLHQNARKSHDMKTGKRSRYLFENITQYRHLGTTVTNQNLIQEEINRRLKSWNACYHSLLSLVCSSLLFKEIQMGILPAVLYGCETWSLTLKEEHRLRVFENRALRRIFGPKRDEVTGEWRNPHKEELQITITILDIIHRRFV